MNARVPQDVDLEDRLLFGLTAVRFGELALACLCGVAVWRAIPVVGGPLAVLLVGIGAAAAWTNWRGRGADHWIVAFARFIVRTRRLEYRQRPATAARAGRARPRLRRAPRATLRVLDGSLD